MLIFVELLVLLSALSTEYLIICFEVVSSSLQNSARALSSCTYCFCAGCVDCVERFYDYSPNISIKMSRCVNCALSLVDSQPRRQIGEATDAMVGILRSWITPATMLVEDVICQECYAILESASLNMSRGLRVERAYGHQQVCFVCGCSMLRAQTHRVSIDSPEGDFIMSCIPTQQVHRLERVCLRCWTNASRSVRRQTQYDQNRLQQIAHGEAVATQEDMDVHTSRHEVVSGTSTPTREFSIPTPPPLPIQQLHQDPIVSHQSKIISSIYKRASASSRYCIFGSCRKTELLLVPSVIKEMLLLDYKVYVPNSARICSYHRNLGVWDELHFHLNDFTGSQMDAMMLIMDRGTRRRFGQMEIKLDPMGQVQKQKFMAWLSNLPCTTSYLVSSTS
ncbi:unnamed protein product [Chrysodeixis includens]|uniref:RING-type domain-containing protein n=1 Tax=Chrysodeixis includens TaxID=689277 RepID=A0A9P0FSB3_CHRIL|nr:unnamed protein product [Chrysodeixis includens]